MVYKENILYNFFHPGTQEGRNKGMKSAYC